MFSGEKINVSRAGRFFSAALRAPRNASILVDGRNVVPDVHAVLDKMAGFATASAAAIGKAIPASGSAMWSTSASAALTSGLSWPMRH